MLKRITILAVCLLLCTAYGIAAQDAKRAALSFDRKEHDFGTLVLGQTYTCIFTVTSVGEGPLVLLGARTSCACAKAVVPGKPLMKGQCATIKVTFEAREPGVFHKQILLDANTPKRTTAITLSGNIVKESGK